ncbi:MAG: hypothetical protein NOOUEUKL_002358, partial [Candidatus Fervidibacter sp.]
MEVWEAMFACRSLIAAISLCLTLAALQPLRFSDNFGKYPAGSAGEPNWEVTD